MAEVDDIATAMKIKDNRQRWQTLVGLTNPSRATRAADFFAARKTTIRWIESGLPLEHLESVRDVQPESSQDEHNRESDAQYIAAKGLTAQHVNDYGPKVCAVHPKDDIDAWEAAGHAPIVLRSLHHRSSHSEIGELISYADAGITRDKDLAAYQQALTFYGGKATIVGVAKHLSPEQATVWSAGNDYQAIDLNEAEATAKMIAAGYDAPDQVGAAYADTIFGPATRYAFGPLPVKPLVRYGNIVGAGMTPQKAEAMTRAGIPPTKLHEHATETDYWAAGEKYRQDYTRQVARDQRQGYDDAPAETAWPVTETDWRACR